MEGIIILLIPLFEKLIEACMERREARRGFDVVAGLRKPGRRERAALWITVWRNRRELGLREKGFSVREVAEYSFNRLCMASDDQVVMLASGDSAELVESMQAEAN